MKSKAKIIIPILTLAVLFTANFASAAVVQCGTTTTSGCTIGDLIQTVINIINLLFSYAGVIAVIIVAIAGFRLAFAGGNEEVISQAKTTLNYAILGFIVILLSFLIINFVVAVATGGALDLPGAFKLIPSS